MMDFAMAWRSLTGADQREAALINEQHAQWRENEIKKLADEGWIDWPRHGYGFPGPYAHEAVIACHIGRPPFRFVWKDANPSSQIPDYWRPIEQTGSLDVSGK